MKIIFVFSLTLVCFLHTTGRPRWITETPAGYVHDYYIGVGRSSISESEARNVALADALQRIVQNGKITLDASQTINTQSTEIFKNGQSLSLDAIDQVVSDIRVVGESKIVTGLREEEYFTEATDGVFTVWSLVRIPKKTPATYESASKYSPVWRSMLLPSWGQFYKGAPTKGYFIAGGTITFAASGFVFSSLKITAESDAKNSRTQVLRDYYNNNANTYNNISIACFIATAAVYVYNVVDALATDGEKVYVYERQNNTNENSMTGYFYPQPQNVLSIRIKI